MVVLAWIIERVVLRLARESAGAGGFSLPALGLHGEGLERVHTLLAPGPGLVVVAAPEGGGMTTTLYTLLDQIDHLTASVATIEEKVGHHFPHVAQTQVRPEAGLTTLAGLRALLKQDPDVVAVDQARDADTVSLAAAAAGRGALVLMGFEAPTAAAAVEKMLDLGVSRTLIASVLRGVVATRIVKKLCGHEREEYRLSRAEGAPLEERANFGKVLAALKSEHIVGDSIQWRDLLFARATPCAECHKGYQGMVGLNEVLMASVSIAEMIRGGKGTDELEACAREEGMFTTTEDGLYKAAQGVTSIEQVYTTSV